MSRDREAREPERVLQRSVQGHVESGRVVRGEYRAINNATGNENAKKKKPKKKKRREKGFFDLALSAVVVNLIICDRIGRRSRAPRALSLFAHPPYSVPRYKIQIVCRGGDGR